MLNDVSWCYASHSGSRLQHWHLNPGFKCFRLDLKWHLGPLGWAALYNLWICLQLQTLFHVLSPLFIFCIPWHTANIAPSWSQVIIGHHETAFPTFLTSLMFMKMLKFIMPVSIKHVYVLKITKAYSGLNPQWHKQNPKNNSAKINQRGKKEDRQKTFHNICI